GRDGPAGRRARRRRRRQAAARRGARHPGRRGVPLDRRALGAAVRHRGGQGGHACLPGEASGGVDAPAAGEGRSLTMHTAVTEMFGIDVPILAFSHCRDVVAAVTRAGGMGVLGAAAHSPEQLEIDLDWIEAEIGDRPYGVDVIVPLSYAGSEAGGLTIQDVRALI